MNNIITIKNPEYGNHDNNDNNSSKREQLNYNTIFQKKKHKFNISSLVLPFHEIFPLIYLIFHPVDFVANDSANAGVVEEDD